MGRLEYSGLEESDNVRTESSVEALVRHRNAMTRYTRVRKGTSERHSLVRMLAGLGYMELACLSIRLSETPRQALKEAHSFDFVHLQVNLTLSTELQIESKSATPHTGNT